MQRKHLIASIAIFTAFAIGLVGFFIVSNGLPDGLEKTIEEHGSQEDPVYHAPLSYGDGYGSALIMGGIGFVLTLVTILGLMKLRRAARSP